MQLLYRKSSKYCCVNLFLYQLSFLMNVLCSICIFFFIRYPKSFDALSKSYRKSCKVTANYVLLLFFRFFSAGQKGEGICAVLLELRWRDNVYGLERLYNRENIQGEIVLRLIKFRLQDLWGALCSEA